MNDGLPDCRVVVTQMHAFFDHELDQATYTVIQQHLLECENCEDSYNVEQKFRVTIRRCCSEQAPGELRSRIDALRASLREGAAE